MVAQQCRVLLPALRDEAGRGGGVEYPDFVRGLLLHADNQEAVGIQRVEVQGGLAVVVVLLGAGQEVRQVLAAGGFEVDERGAAAGAAGYEQVGADFNGYAGGGVGGRVRQLGGAAV